MKYVFFYLLFINLLGVLVTAYDKFAAKNNMRRVSEKNLFLLSAIGASVSVYTVMRIIHHKTLHKRFMIGIPIIILLVLTLIIKFS